MSMRLVEKIPTAKRRKRAVKKWDRLMLLFHPDNKGL